MKSDTKYLEIQRILPTLVLKQMNDQSLGMLLLLPDTSKIYRECLVTLAEWPADLNDDLSAHLALQYQPLPRDHEGNVCFADDPGLRPEFRTWFHAAHLFDYYYALWQMIPEESEKISQLKFPFPENQIFWTMVHIGEKLRKIHMKNTPVKERGIIFYDSGRNDDYFKPLPKAHWSAITLETGRIYLNRSTYIEPVPISAWNYKLSGIYPVRTCLEELTDDIVVSKEQIQELIEFITKISDSVEYQEGVRITLERTHLIY